MDALSHLHTGEQLLCSLHASKAALMRTLLRGCGEGLVVAAIVSVLLFALVFFAQVAFPSFAWLIPALLPVVGMVWLRYRGWKRGLFRVTTERILIASPYALFHAPLVTIKWAQYQESEVGHRSPLDVVFLARPLRIRYGTADAKNEIIFPSIRYAEDLKHFLDKVDSAVRAGNAGSLKVFVAKPRGKRD
jgi:hypothetical protein